MKTVFQTPDGRVFDSAEQAAEHERGFTFDTWLQSQPLIDPSELLGALDDVHKTEYWETDRELMRTLMYTYYLKVIDV